MFKNFSLLILVNYFLNIFFKCLFFYLFFYISSYKSFYVYFYKVPFYVSACVTGLKGPYAEALAPYGAGSASYKAFYYLNFKLYL